ncbi:2-oxoacid:ferredoxin oxidoreductase subunit beta, partial [Sulfolobus sp. E3]
AYDVKHLKELIKKAIKHKGLAMIDVLQPCPTYNDIHTKEYYDKRVYKLDDDPSWDPVVKKPEEIEEKMKRAITRSMEWGERIPIGVFFQNELVSTYEQRIVERSPSYLDNPHATDAIEYEGKPTTQIDDILNERKVG